MTAKWWVPAFIGLGSNLDGPGQQIAAAIEGLATIEQTRVWRTSPIYRSAPMGPQDQPDYLNAVTALLTRLAPRALLGALQQLEQSQGRVRDGRRWGPRRIDLDLLLHGDTVVSGSDLVLPHPGLTDRVFVLAPLADLAPERRLPDGKTVRVHLAAHDRGQIQQQEEPGTS
ncbi:MAG: 2-amino-4-hydroxy-6-hydroxymethyldihydropteridine diphosphokinase [Gammaproteobacteria bacterium]|nr:2-amino-4-hydroxy-6-hydroxymethyldihydropteridine diphosphokinase [Gammaproteobacteria bacterium]